ncbi:MAG TPA: MMPL family transporter [Gaiellaceae bacterium]|nr:MMPL family transporter [Gaiellaceae bacterium]
MGRWAHTMIRFRWAVLGVWLVLFLAAGAASSGLSDLLTNRFTLPGSDSEDAATILKDHFGQKPEGSFSVVVKGAPGTADSLVPKTRLAAQRAARELPTGKVVDVRAVSPDVVSATIASELQPADAKGHTGDMRDAAGTIPGAQLWITGQSAVEHDLDPVFAEDLKVGELFIAIPIAMAILIFVFGTLAFLLPMLLALASIPVTLGIIWIFANFMDLSTYLQNLVMLIGLGIAIDYSLLMVYRYREEHRAGRSREEAVARTLETAGRAVIFSGTAVAIGLALMLFMPLPFMRGFGLAGLLIPLVSVLAAMTLLPVLLYLLEDRLDRVRLVPKRVIERRADHERGFWARLAPAIMRRPLVFAGATAAALLLFAWPVTKLDLGPGTNEGIPQNLQAVQGLNVLTDAVGEGAIAPTDIVIDTGKAGGGKDPEVKAALGRLTGQLRGDAEVADVVDGQSPQFMDSTGRYLHVQAIGKHEYGVPDSQEFVDRLRDVIVPNAAFPAGTKVLAGGGPPGGVDFIDMTYGAFPWLVLAVLILTYLLLLRAFRSLLLPLKAIVMNLLSIGAAYGLLVLFFKYGWGEAFGLQQFDQIEAWIPVFLFAMLFGLSMDYEVFLVSRMREEWDKRGENVAAVTTGLQRTGRLVTAAGLIMFAAFMGFVAGSIVGLQQFGFGLAAAIIIDVTIIRALLVPSIMKLFGRWNWWLPERVARIVRVEPSPLAPKVEAPAPALHPAGR